MSIAVIVASSGHERTIRCCGGEGDAAFYLGDWLEGDRMQGGEPPPALLSEREVAALLRVSLRTLRRWRLEADYGPPHVRIGRFIRYRPEDVSAWIAEQRGNLGPS